MHNKHPEDVQRPETDGCSNLVNAPQAAMSTVAPLMPAERMRQMEKDTVNNLYRAIGEFVTTPTLTVASDVHAAMNMFHDAWMAGRRRVMD